MGANLPVAASERLVLDAFGEPMRSEAAAKATAGAAGRFGSLQAQGADESGDATKETVTARCWAARRGGAGLWRRIAVCPALSRGCREPACTEEAARLGALVDPVRPAGGPFEQPTEFTSMRLLPPAAAPGAPSGCGVRRAGFTT